ncbi:uncharacterized protein VTP21DRAFT_5152 [Calcarisporiella thermophila]|uniref:uncharacterized protein n=1 Tax=Calcarisporiella thermophila TaxID=911321 RepID=UPI0037425578
MDNQSLAVIIVVVVVVACVLIHSITFFIAAFLAKRTASPYHALVVRLLRWPTALLVPVLGALFSLPLIAMPPDVFNIIRHALVIVLIISIAWLLLNLIKLVTQSFELNWKEKEPTHRRQATRTQTVVITRTLSGILIVAAIGAIIFSFPQAYQIGASLLASAGIMSLIVGLSARPFFENMVASLQIAITQPITLDDEVTVEGELGVVEEIGAQYVVVRTLEDRRLIVPLTRFITHPFVNWTRKNTGKLGYVFLWLDYGARVDVLRKRLLEICEESVCWDRRVAVVHIVECTDRCMQVRFTVSARNAPFLRDLRNYVREKLIEYVQQQRPSYLPRSRNMEVERADKPDSRDAQVQVPCDGGSPGPSNSAARGKMPSDDAELISKTL